MIDTPPLLAPRDFLFWHTRVRRGKRHQTEWLIAGAGYFHSYTAHRSSTVLDVARHVFDQPGRAFDVKALGYTNSETGPAVWRRAFLDKLIRIGLERVVETLGPCLVLSGDNRVTYRPGLGIRVFTRKNAVSLIEFVPFPKSAVSSVP